MICRENDLVGMGLITLILPATTLHVINRKGSSLTSDWRSRNTLFGRRVLG